MQTEYKYIIFEDRSDCHPKKKTQTWECSNRSGEYLGDVKWNGSWRQYCWYQADDIVMAKSCLDDVSDFIRQLMEARKQG